MPVVVGQETRPRRKPCGDGLCAVSHAELAEEPAGVRLDGVLGEVELAADLAVALALAHAAQHLQLTLGELDAGVRGRPRRGYRGAGQRVRERGHQLGRDASHRR